LHHLPTSALLEGRLPLVRYRDMLAGLHAYHGAALPVCHAADAALGLYRRARPAGRLDR
jgi:hypothetical protein